MVDNKDLSADPTSHKGANSRTLRLIIILGILLFVIIGLPVLVIWLLEKNAYDSDVRYSQANLNDQIAAIRSGKTKAIYLYNTSGTDGLLKQLINVPEIEWLKMDLTDVSDEGMKSLTTLPKLKFLVIYGGRPSVSDRGFSYIKTISSLEHLELINTQVTDQSLLSLKELPNLRSLELFHEAWRGSTFTDAGLEHLKDLTKLQQLQLTGGWASDTAINELQKALPNCMINKKTTEE